LAGYGLGSGQGRGDRPESESSEQFYESQVRAQVGKGRSIFTGFASGPNATGDVLTEIQTAMDAADRQETDPVAEARIPPSHREHARQYFDSMRDE
jgi:hypothetical protein